jgi:hypothetical protein
MVDTLGQRIGLGRADPIHLLATRRSSKHPREPLAGAPQAQIPPQAAPTIWHPNCSSSVRLIMKSTERR